MDSTDTNYTQRLIVGSVLALIWMAGLYGVLEAESLLTKVLVLAAMAPVCLALDAFVSRAAFSLTEHLQISQSNNTRQLAAELAAVRASARYRSKSN